MSKLIDYVEGFIDKALVENQKLPKLLFLKGKSYNSEVLELGINNKIIFEEYPSITDKHGTILYIKKIDKFNIEND